MKKAVSAVCFFFTLFIQPGCRDSDFDQKSTSPFQAELGHYLFFENNISINHTKSCASCHSPEFAFTDGYRRSVTALGENVPHNSPSLINATSLRYFDWANPMATSFAQQIKRPLYNESPMELGLDKHLDELQYFFKNDSLYSTLFKKAFPYDTILYTLNQIEKCLIEYEKCLVSYKSPFDQNKLSNSAQRGFDLFKSDRLKCARCHMPPSFTLATMSNNTDIVYANIGLYNVNGNNQYPDSDAGLINHTHQAGDNGKFKIPSLRNIMITAPYMHDGSVATIEEVIDLYKRGGRNINYGNIKGDGALNKLKSPLIQGFNLTAEESQDLINFLDALSDTTIRSNTLFKNPFQE